jgi:cobalt-precorrin 5A hydrolase
MASENKRHQGLAVLCLTRQACELGIELTAAMGECTLYLPQRLKNEALPSKDIRYFDNWATMFSQVFSSYSKLVCIMAAGIVVRSLASRLDSKYLDPAVVVVDEKGQYAISLLSGHIGGANQLAVEVARLLGGEAVITTATDVQGKTAADLIAMEIDAVIEPPENLKIINRNLAEEQKVYLYSPWPLIGALKSGFSWQDWPADQQAKDDILGAASETDMDVFLDPAVIISHHRKHTVAKSGVLWLKPRNLAVGIGCRKGVSYSDLSSAIDEVLHKYNIDERCIKHLASIDFKVDEPAINLLAEELNIPFLTFGQGDILTLAGTYQESAWVEEITGVGGVCEPAARLASRQGITVVPKQKIGPITISIAMEKSWWLDWDRETATI